MAKATRPSAAVVTHLAPEQTFADIAAVRVDKYWALPLFHCRLLGRTLDDDLMQHVPQPALHLFEEATVPQ